jgi:hypothetical protein
VGSQPITSLLQHSHAAVYCITVLCCGARFPDNKLRDRFPLHYYWLFLNVLFFVDQHTFTRKAIFKTLFTSTECTFILSLTLTRTYLQSVKMSFLYTAKNCFCTLKMVNFRQLIKIRSPYFTIFVKMVLKNLAG